MVRHVQKHIYFFGLFISHSSQKFIFFFETNHFYCNIFYMNFCDNCTLTHNSPKVFRDYFNYLVFIFIVFYLTYKIRHYYSLTRIATPPPLMFCSCCVC